jgi:uncharacterized protein involved in exopolysaccharide biosynthesis
MTRDNSRSATVNELETIASLDAEPKPVPPSVALMTALWRGRRLLAKFLIGGLLVSTAIAFLIPNYYKSTVELMPPGWQSPGGNLAAPFSAMAALSGASMAMSGGGGGLASLVNGHSPSGPILGIIASRTMQDYIIQRFNLQHVYHKKYLADARKVLSRQTDASEDKKTGIISIAITDRSPQRAQDMAAACIEELNKLVVSMDNSDAHKKRVFLEGRVKEIQASLETSEKQLGHFSSKTGTIDAGAQSRAILYAVSSIQGQLIAAKSTLRELETVYSDNSSLVKQAQARVLTLSSQLAKIEGQQGVGASDLDMDQPFPSLRQLPLLGVTFADLYRRTRTLEEAYGLLDRELEAARLEEAEEMPSVKVLDPPVVAQKKSFPPRLILIAVGTLLGLLIGGWWIKARDDWDRLDNSHPAKLLANEVVSTVQRVRRNS